MIRRIAHIVRRFAFAEWGGTENVVWQLAQAQRQLGLEVEILATAALDHPGEEVRDGIKIRRFPYRYPYFPMTSRTRLALDKKGGNPYAPELLRALAHGNFDVFHFHTGGRLIQYGSKLAHRLHRGVLLSLHGGSCAVPPQEMALMLRPLRGKFSYGGLLDRLCRVERCPERCADGLIALSKLETELLQKKFPQQRIFQLPNGVTPPRALPRDPEFRKRYNIPEHAQIILNISRIDYQKNQLLLLQLLDHLRHEATPVHLLLIGPITSDWYYEKMVEFARLHHLQPHLTIIPGLPHDAPELTQSLQECACFVLPSLHEPFGIVALEALSAGAVVLAARTGGLTDFLQDQHNALLFDANNLTELATAFHRVIQDDALRQQLIAAGKTTAQHYAWPQINARLMQIYEEVTP